MNPFRHFDKTSWTADRPIAKSLPTLDSTAQKDGDIHPCLKRDSNSRSRPLGNTTTTTTTTTTFVEIFCSSVDAG